jgi:hypothetical protein
MNYWISYGLPFRPIYGTYGRTDIKLLPPIKEIKSCFAKINNLEDVKKNLNMLNKTIKSPTSSYFDVDGNAFYHDQQGCVTWYFSIDDGVYTINKSSKNIITKTLSEFLQRIYLESYIWFKSMSIKHQ